MNKDFAKGMIVSMALKALPVRKKSPIAYLYNGVRLPALPEWDRERYPYAWITYHGTSDNVSYYRFIFSATNAVKKYIFGKGDYLAVVNTTAYILYTDDDNWTFLFENNSNDNVLSTHKLLWCNEDILDSSGNVYFEASDPIPIYNEPVNYLYNGVKLPKLPEWDKTVYPYAVIINLYFGAGTYVRFLPSVEYETMSNGNWGLKVSSDSLYSELTNGEWGVVSSKGNDSYIAVGELFCWASFDITNADGSVYLAASEPIPVYE